MLKGFGYSGVYRDENLYLDFLLENPLDFGISADKLTFSFKVVQRNGDMEPIQHTDFTFYLMGSDNCLYGTQIAPYAFQDASVVVGTCDESKMLRGLITTDLRPAYLFQDLRIAVYIQVYDRIEIVTLRRH
jgi:hypothetical protein